MAEGLVSRTGGIRPTQHTAISDAPTQHCLLAKAPSLPSCSDAKTLVSHVSFKRFRQMRTAIHLEQVVLIFSGGLMDLGRGSPSGE